MNTISYIIKIDGEDVSQYVESEFSVTTKLDESFDEGKLILSGIDKEEPYPQLSNVEITATTTEGSGTTFDYCIASDFVEIVSKSSNLLYKHNLMLIELTEKLKIYSTESLSFTQPVDKTSIRYTMEDVIRRILKYSPTRLNSNRSINDNDNFILDSSLASKLSVITAPQFFLKNLNLFKALSQVFKAVDAVPRVRRDRINQQNILDADFLNERGTEITNVNIINQIKTADINEYGVSIFSNIENMVSEDNIDVSAIIYPGINAWINMRAAADVIFASSTAEFRVQKTKPIYRMVKVEALVKRLELSKSPGDQIVIQNEAIDITKSVVEKKIWETLEFSSSRGESEGTLGFKNNTIYFEYGGSAIKTAGATYGEGNIINISGDVFTVFINLLYATIKDETGYSFTPGVDDDPQPLDTKDYLIRIHYVPIEKGTVSVERTDISIINKETTFVSNQQENIISLQNYMNNMYGQIQRTGLGSLEYTNIESVFRPNIEFRIGDFTSDGYVVTARELIFNRNNFTQKVELNRNENKIDQKISIDNENRQSPIAGDKSVLERTVKINEYALFTLENNLNDNDNKIITSEGIRAFMNTFDPDSLDLTPATVFTIDPADPSITRLIISGSAVGGANSLKFNFGFEDNVFAGDQLLPGEPTINQGVKYTEEDGTLDSLDFRVYNNTAIIEDDYSANVFNAQVIPKLFSSSFGDTLLLNANFVIDKDPGEILNVEYQLHMHPSSNTIVVGQYSTLLNSLVNGTITDTHVYISFDEIYTSLDTKEAKGLRATDGVVTSIGVTPYYIRATSALFTASVKSWAVATIDGKLLLGVNSTETTVFVNFISERKGINKIW